jgi:acyl-coenzyme A synthetase/AMP-(fatty) acid ligase
LLPPNYTPSFVERLGERYPDLYCLADGEIDLLRVEVMQYPQLPETDDTDHAIPAIPTERLAALVFTSGSTGQPVAHPKSWGSLCKGAIAEASSLGVAQNSGMAVLGTVPAQHMYGLESCMLLALQNGLTLVAERPFYPADICAQLAALTQPRCLVTTPVHLRTLLSEAVELPSVEFVLCATAHLAPQLASEAEARFDAPLYEIYGCTEAGMVASRRTTQGRAWHLLPGVELQQDEQGNRVHGGHVEIEAPLSDVIERNADGTFILHGRTADMVNIAGKRTSLASLNHLLNEIPGVQDGVFFMPDDSDGAMKRPLAFVVAPGLRGAEIMDALRNSVDAVFLPRPLYFVDALPRNSTGKITRETLMQLMERCAKK